MKLFRRFVVAALMTVWFFPTASFANTQPVDPQAASSPFAARPATQQPAQSAEVANLAAREKQAQSQNLSDFNGGAVYVYLGSGAVLVLIIILIILLI
jgi:hypothetical protein